MNGDDITPKGFPPLPADAQYVVITRAHYERAQSLDATIHNKDAALEAYRVEVEQYRFVLESVEWIIDSNGSFCPSCGCWQEFGHDSKCLINRALTGRAGEGR